METLIFGPHYQIKSRRNSTIFHGFNYEPFFKLLGFIYILSKSVCGCGSVCMCAWMWRCSMLKHIPFLALTPKNIFSCTIRGAPMNQDLSTSFMAESLTYITERMHYYPVNKYTRTKPKLYHTRTHKHTWSIKFT